MNTVVSRRSFDLAHAGLLLLLPVIFYWAVLLFVAVANENAMEQKLIFYSIVPRTIFGLHDLVFLFLLTSSSLFLSIMEKLKRHTRWYKTSRHIQLAILSGTLFMFLLFLKALL